MINDNNNNNELEIMRTQLNALKSQLAQQEIVTENLIIDAMKKKMTWIKKYVIFQICLIPVLAIIWAAIIPICGISWWNYAFLLIMCCIDVYADYRINVSSISDDDYLRGNLVTTVKKLLKMKRYRALQMAICIPLIIVWLLWAGIEAVCRSCINASRVPWAAVRPASASRTAASKACFFSLSPEAPA